ncbi:MAG: leucine--tRNA ligase [Candidatus Wildermuthbacteria bacterium]|nr:leucine--tRNA ligase [Candidatus Wildermuthbacteria bacterium]
MPKYNPQKIEQKWRKIWERKKAWKVDIKKAKKPYYNLMMFPYPSAEGLHVGNVYAFTGSDIHGRFRKMQGFDVFEPMGFDAFGIHSENFAIRKGVHPKIQNAKNIKNFTKQLKQLGALFAWDHAVDTTKPEYYKWTQWIFLQLYKAGLAYRGKAPVDWCPSCKTVLADEQVINGKCERCSSQVIQKQLEQWFFRITKYAERLLKNLETIDWSERTKTAQQNWIGKSEGFQIEFPIKDVGKDISIVTTRPDTIFGATFMVLAPEHKLVQELRNRIGNWDQVQVYVAEASKKNEFERGLATKEKNGIILKGIQAVNPASQKEIPVFIADYVLGTYGTGAIMAVPAHDDRDFAFAKKFNLPIQYVVEKPVQQGVISVYLYDSDDSEVAHGLRKMGQALEYVSPTQRRYDIPLLKAQEIIAVLQRNNLGKENDHQAILQGKAFGLEVEPRMVDFGIVHTGDGIHVNSDFLNGLNTKEAIGKMSAWLKEKRAGRTVIHYHLRDWLISRQRYWGPPIPVVYCQSCGIVPVPEKDLPVLLPYVKDFRPTGGDQSPLAAVHSFVKTKCPQCKKPAQRETDVSDTFLDSAWYFLRYPSVKIQNSKLKIPWDQKITHKWLPVDMYIGGQEHAVLHLLYTRFITMALKDLKHIDFEEPFKKFRAHGLLTKDGAKMSKSKGNVVNPDEYFKKYGADTVRMYLMFVGPFAEAGDWSDKGIVGIARFLNRVWDIAQKTGKSGSSLDALRSKTIKKVTDDLENLRYNTAISSLMEYANVLGGEGLASKEDVKTILLLLAPFAPHITEELWQKLGNKKSIHQIPWPQYQEKALQESNARWIVQVNGKVRDILEFPANAPEELVKKKAMESKKLEQWLKGKQVQRTVFVKGKLLNFVV